jgi:hypothetical protein
MMPGDEPVHRLHRFRPSSSYRLAGADTGERWRCRSRRGRLPALAMRPL